MKGVLPDQILTRSKMGFPVPIGRWFRGPFKSVIDEYVLSDRALARDIFEPDFVRQLVSLHQSGEDHSERLWALLNFEIWLRQFFDGERVSPSKELDRQLALAT
jgi:asparagine synthase (glutamine-hydrolysing)